MNSINFNVDDKDLHNFLDGFEVSINISEMINDVQQRIYIYDDLDNIIDKHDLDIMMVTVFSKMKNMVHSCFLVGREEDFEVLFDELYGLEKLYMRKMHLVEGKYEEINNLVDLMKENSVGIGSS